MAAEGNAPSWTTTPPAVIGVDHNDDTDTTWDTPSTPAVVRDWRAHVQLHKRLRENSQMPQPDDALHTVRGFVVCPEALGSAMRAAAAVESSANTTTVPEPKEREELSEQEIAWIRYLNHRFNQGAVQHNHAIDAGLPTAATAADAINQTQHVEFAKLPPGHHSLKKTKHVTFDELPRPLYPAKSKNRAAPQTPSPEPPPPSGLQFEKSLPEEVWLKTYRCVRKGESCTFCHSRCLGITVWCEGDKKFAPCMRGPNRHPDGSKGKDTVEFDMASLREECASF